MFIINPDPYCLPCYRIGPFMTRDLSVNHCLPDSDIIDGVLEERFQGRDFIYTLNGRQAIDIALNHYNLKEDDVVSILTTSGNFYISGCVTKEIEKYCKWSRHIVAGTKVIFVNHEFGYPYTDLCKLKEYNLPIIEDCAGSFFSSDSIGDIGTIGDFAIYSFPKMFPLQIGGLLLSNLPGKLDKNDQLDKRRLRHVKSVLSHHIIHRDEIIDKRISNYLFLKHLFEPLGFPERFPLVSGIVPGVFMFRTDNYHFDLPELKKYVWAHGVQSSVFYGEEAFFIPVHQALNENDMVYFSKVIDSFIHKSEV